MCLCVVCLSAQSAGAFDGHPGSQLLLVGVQHVHALYAALLALPWCEPGQPDVPLLSAPVPFLHAQLCPLLLVVSLPLPDRVLAVAAVQRKELECLWFVSHHVYTVWLSNCWF